MATVRPSKPAARPFVGFITTPQLPGAYFDSREALLAFVHERIAIEKICATFEKDRDADMLAIDLAPFGYDREEIAAIVARPHVRPREMYISG